MGNSAEFKIVVEARCATENQLKFYYQMLAAKEKPATSVPSEAWARGILGCWLERCPETGVYGSSNDDGAYVDLVGIDDKVVLDGAFSVEQVEALAWWLRNKGLLSDSDNRALPKKETST